MSAIKSGWSEVPGNGATIAPGLPLCVPGIRAKARSNGLDFGLRLPRRALIREPADYLKLRVSRVCLYAVRAGP